MTTRNPWLGLASYDVPKDKEEDYLFCGRDEETMDIVRLIDNNLFITLYGSSGIGKTSLLKAGVIPILKRKDYFPLYVRLSQESNEISYAEAIVRHLKNCGLTEESHVALEHADSNDRLFLWNYFATTRFLDADGREIYPVIILDQFEEVFRDGDKAKAELLLQQIYLLLNDELEMPDAEGYSADTNYRFVDSIREDYLFVLEDSIDELSLDLYKSNRYRLRPMKPENARQVVLIPGRDCILETEKKKVAERVLELAKKPQSDDIDTLLLSLVCAGTFDKKAGEKITFGDLSIWKDNPMQIYYQDAMRVLNANQIRYIQQHLIREDGSRKRVSVEELKKALGENDFQQLTKGKNRLFSIGDKGQAELLHDKLAMAVYEERKAFEERERKKKLRRRVSVIGILVLAIAGVFFFQNTKLKQQRWKMLENQSKLVAEKAISLAKEDSYLAQILALEILPKDLNHPVDRPYTLEAEGALREANLNHSAIIKTQNRVGSAIYSPDGKEIMTSSKSDSTFRFYDRRTGGIIRSFKTGYYCKNCSYSSDGKQILSCCDSLMIILDAQDGSIMKTIIVDTSEVNSIKYDLCGKRIITSSGHTIKIWDAETGLILKTIESKGFFKYALFSPNGKLMAAFEIQKDIWIENKNKVMVFDEETIKDVFQSKNKVMILDTETYKEIQSFTIIGNDSHIDFSPDGKKLLASSTQQNEIKVWDIETRELLFTISTDHCQNVAFSPDGEKILSSANHGFSISSNNNPKTIKIWETHSGEELQTLYGHKFVISSAVFSPNGDEVVSVSEDKTIRIWDLKANDNSNILVKSDERMYSADINPDLNLIAANVDEKGIVVWDMQTGKEKLELKDDHFPTAPAINPNGKQILFVTWDSNSHIPSNLNFYDLDSQKTTKTITDTIDGFEKIVFSPDGQKIVYLSNRNNKIKLMDLETFSVIWTIEKSILSMDNVKFSPNGKQVLYVDNKLKFYDATTGEELLVSSDKHNSHLVFDAEFSPDGKTIATAAEDNIIRIWDAETGNCIKVLEGHENGVLCVSFSPDGKYLASGSKDKTIRVWELQSGACVCEYKGHYASVSNISFTSDGKQIISLSDDWTSDDWTIRKWPFPPLQELIDQTRERFKDRPLTDEERKMYYLE